jgi:hypothetical protein
LLKWAKSLKNAEIPTIFLWLIVYVNVIIYIVYSLLIADCSDQK